jgi:CRISPR/Cas system CSM-associated protein Csm2 small subunit
MSTKELIQAKIEQLDEEQLKRLYQEIQRISQPEKMTSSTTLMAKLRRIEIDGPEDFAANLDLYSNGERRVP